MLKPQITEEHVKREVKEMYTDLEGWSFAPVQSGKGEHGIPDRIGFIPVTVTPEMVGTVLPVFVAVEAKKPGRRGEKFAGCTGQQVDKLRDITAHEGVAALVDHRSDLDFVVKMLRLLTTDPRGAKVALAEQLERRINNRG
jgi:hypothetical protein